MNQSTQGNFQKIFMIGGFVLGVLGIFVFSISQFGKSNIDPNLTGNIVVWGVLPAEKMTNILYEYSQAAKTYSVTYVEVPEDKFIKQFIGALANDEAPDILLTPENITVPLRIYSYPFDSNFISENNFKTTFIRSTYKFFGNTSVYGFPLAVDPLIMYVNTDILTNAGFSKAPETWGDIPLYVTKVLGFTSTDNNSVQRAIALGSLNNILHNREILLTLLMQLKNNVIERTFVEKTVKDPVTKQDVIAYDVSYQSVFALNSDEGNIKNDALAEQIFTFFTSFVNPNIKEVYTWSKKAPIDRDLFASGNLGLYFGFASDKEYIDTKNPHLNYEVALVPSPKGPTASFKNTSYARIYTLSMITKTKKLQLATKVLQDMLSKDIADKIVVGYNLAPAKQDELYKYLQDKDTKAVTQKIDEKSPFKNIVYLSADRGDIVLEPIPNLLNTIFGQIVDALSGSRQTPSDIIKNADAELTRQLK